MNQDHLDLETETVAFESEILEQVDELADRHHRGNREAAIRDLLDEWLKVRNE